MIESAIAAFQVRVQQTDTTRMREKTSISSGGPRLCTNRSLRRTVPPRRIARRRKPKSLEGPPPEERVNPGGWRTAAAGQGASRGLRAPLSRAKPRVTSGGSWAAPELLGAPAANPSKPGRRRGQRTPLLVRQSPSFRRVQGSARSRLLHSNFQPTPRTRSHTHTHAHNPSWPEKPPGARSKPLAFSEGGGAGNRERAGDPASSNQIPAGEAPPEAKKTK